MRQAEVQSRFLETFGTLFPQLTFRGLRRLPRATFPYQFVLRVGVGKAGIELDLLCLALSEGFPQEIERAVQRLQAKGSRADLDAALPVLIAPYFSADGRALCRAAGLGYLDLAGNAWLETAQAYLEISGKMSGPLRAKRISSPFKGKAERVVRTLLLEPERQWAMRDLAQAAGVSLGSASMVTSALADLGAVIKRRSRLKLFNPAVLLEAWSQTYDLKRSPFRIYRSWINAATLEQRLVEQHGLLEAPCALTLWSGALHLLGEPRPANRLALYWGGQPEELARTLHLSTESGKTTLFIFQPYDASVFWGARETENGLAVVHPLQLYLDLGSGDEEELGLARRVRERLLAWSS